MFHVVSFSLYCQPTHLQGTTANQLAIIGSVIVKLKTANIDELYTITPKQQLIIRF